MKARGPSRNGQVLYEHFVIKIKEKKVLFADGRRVSPTEAVLLSTPTEAWRCLRSLVGFADA